MSESHIARLVTGKECRVKLITGTRSEYMISTSGRISIQVEERSINCIQCLLPLLAVYSHTRCQRPVHFTQTCRIIKTGKA